VIAYSAYSINVEIHRGQDTATVANNCIVTLRDLPRHFGHTDWLIWIDATCIDQSDRVGKTEKSTYIAGSSLQRTWFTSILEREMPTDKAIGFLGIFAASKKLESLLLYWRQSPYAFVSHADNFHGLLCCPWLTRNRTLQKQICSVGV
jgi:hypothetical protein